MKEKNNNFIPVTHFFQLPDAKRQVSEEKREQRTKHNRFQIMDIKQERNNEQKPRKNSIDHKIPQKRIIN